MALKNTESSLSDDDGRAPPRGRASARAPAASRFVSADRDRETIRDGRDDGRNTDHNDRDLNNADRELSDDERFALFQSAILQSVLPNLPTMPGYHLCWLTTNNPRDSVAMRVRLGYELISQDMIAGWKGESLKSGEYKGVISINEMIAARIPLRLYNRYMKEAHDALPRQEEEKLRAVVTGLKDSAQTVGTRIAEEGDGTADIVQRARPMPEFSS